MDLDTFRYPSKTIEISPLRAPSVLKGGCEKFVEV